MASLREIVYLDSAPKVDVASGELRNVKLLGMESRNKRRYKREAMANAVPLYQGRKIYIDHPSRAEAESDRSMDRWAGTIQEARLGEDGIYGTIKLRKKSPYFEGIIEAAEDFPKDVGFSHVADGESNFEGDTEIVESIREVFSVDLVTDPATTAGFFESRRKPKPKTIRQALESLPEGTVRSRLMEMIGAAYDVDVEVKDDKPADPLTAAYAVIDALVAQLGEALKALAMKKDTPPPTPNPEAKPVVPVEKDETPEALKVRVESLTKENATLREQNAALTAKCLLLESGREATDVRVKALAREADEAGRKALLESWEQSTDGERPHRSPPLTESGPADASPENIREAFKALASAN